MKWSCMPAESKNNTSFSTIKSEKQIHNSKKLQVTSTVPPIDILMTEIIKL
jgi:hypothetical protein